MTYFYFSNRILSIFFFYAIILNKKFQASQSEGTGKFEHCNNVKGRFGDGVINDKNWWYIPKCKIYRPDLFDNIQVGRTDKFCVNVSTGIPFYRTAKSINKELNCDIAVYKLTIKTQSHVINISEMIKSKLEEMFRGSVGNQLVRTVAQVNSSINPMLAHLEIYSIGHRSTDDILSLLKSRISEGQIGSVEFDSDQSNISIITSNLKDPPELLYIPNKPEMSITSDDFSMGDMKKRSAVIEDKNKNGSQDKFDTGFILVISAVVVVGCIVIILSILYCIYRLRKKDEGSYVLNKNMVLANNKAKKSMILVSNAKEYFA